MTEEKEKIYITAFGDVFSEGDEKEMAKAIERLQELANEFLEVPQPIEVCETDKSVFTCIQHTFHLDGAVLMEREFTTEKEAQEFASKMNADIEEEIRNDRKFMRAVEIPKGAELSLTGFAGGMFPEGRNMDIILGETKMTIGWSTEGLKDNWLPLDHVEHSLKEMSRNRPIHAESGVDVEWDGINKTLTVTGHGRCEFGEVSGNLVVEDDVEVVAAKVTGTAEVRDEASSLVVGGKRIEPESESEDEGIKR